MPVYQQLSLFLTCVFLRLLRFCLHLKCPLVVVSETLYLLCGEPCGKDCHWAETQVTVLSIKALVGSAQ